MKYRTADTVRKPLQGGGILLRIGNFWEKFEGYQREVNCGPIGDREADRKKTKNLCICYAPAEVGEEARGKETGVSAPTGSGGVR